MPWLGLDEDTGRLDSICYIEPNPPQWGLGRQRRQALHSHCIRQAVRGEPAHLRSRHCFSLYAIPDSASRGCATEQLKFSGSKSQSSKGQEAVLNHQRPHRTARGKVSSLITKDDVGKAMFITV